MQKEKIKSKITEIVDKTVFEKNDDTLRQRTLAEVQSFLLSRAIAGDVDDFAVLCDEDNNKQELIDAGGFQLDTAILYLGDSHFETFRVRILPPAQEKSQI